MTPRYWTDFSDLVSELKLECSLLPVRDGTCCTLYEAGPREAPTLVLVSPGESPFLLISNLFKELSQDLRVVSWDHPGSPFMEHDGRAPPATTDVMAQTLLDVIAGKNLTRPHIATWCVGALAPVWAFALDDTPFASMSFIAPPSILSRCTDRTAFQSDYLPLLVRLAHGARRYEADLVARIRHAAEAWPVITSIDQAIFDLTHLPIREGYPIRRYAELISFMCMRSPPARDGRATQAYADLMDDICRKVPLALLHSIDDEVARHECSADIAARNPGVRLILYPQGAHFMQFRDPKPLAKDIRDFIYIVEGGHL